MGIIAAVIAIIYSTVKIIKYQRRPITYENTVNAVVVSPEGEIIDSGELEIKSILTFAQRKLGKRVDDMVLTGYIKGMGIYDNLGINNSSRSDINVDVKSDYYDNIFACSLIHYDKAPYLEDGEWIYPLNTVLIDMINPDSNYKYKAWVIDYEGAYSGTGDLGITDIFMKDEEFEMFRIRYTKDDLYPEGSYVLAPAENEKDVQNFLDKIEK